jgi:RNA polymerase sigma-70 factor, ECF subfamily
MNRSSVDNGPLAAETFATYLEARKSREGASEDAFEVADLELCFFALRGDPTALKTLHVQHFGSMDPHLRRLGLDPGEVDDVKQVLLRTLLVASEDTPPRLEQYDGRGPLQAWLRVAAVREGLKVLRKKKREVPIDEADMLLDKAAPADPELAYMKALYRDAFRAAFQESVAALDDRQKTILRQSLIDGLSIDELARLYNTHRATTARWVQSAREEVVSETRKRFLGKLQVSSDECDSVFRMISTHLDVTLRRHLV